MSEIALLDQTVQWLEEAPISGQTLDDKDRQLLQAEYLRKLGQFHRADMVLSRKYGMDFRQFVGQRVVEKNIIVGKSKPMPWIGRQLSVEFKPSNVDYQYCARRDLYSCEEFNCDMEEIMWHRR